VLVVSFTDTSGQPRTVVEQALRESQARERSAREQREAQQRATHEKTQAANAALQRTGQQPEELNAQLQPATARLNRRCCPAGAPRNVAAPPPRAAPAAR